MTAALRLFRCRADNYGVLLHDPMSQATAAIDAPDADAIGAELAVAGWRLTDILLTHHHDDHVAGVADLVAATGCRVVAPAADGHRLAQVTRHVVEGDRVDIKGPADDGDGLRGDVLSTPGHTAGHVAYWFAGLRLVFAGDTLFSLGCGRLFEGTPAAMWGSLMKLRALPDDTQLYCGHEYSLGNARFALTIEPDNAALVARAAVVEDLVAHGRPTIPSTIGLEKATNPFLRADQPQIARAVGLPGAPAAEVFAELRRRKDRF